MRAVPLLLALSLLPAATLARPNPEPPPGEALRYEEEGPEALHRGRARYVAVERDEVVRRLEAMEARLTRAARMARRDPELRELLRQTRAELETVRAHVAEAPPARRPRTVEAPPPAPPQGPTPLPPPHVRPIQGGELERLVRDVRRAPSDEARLAILRPAAAAHLFAVAQVQALLPLYGHAGARLQAVRELRPHLLDLAQNGHQLYAAFEHPRDRDALARILAG